MLLLPGVPDERDACVARLEQSLGAEPGITLSHLVDGEGRPALCLHFDGQVMALSRLEGLARGAGARIQEQFGHVVLALRAVDSEDAARRIEARLQRLDGVVHVAVNLPAQRALVEFERALVAPAAIEAELRRMGYGVTQVPVAALPPPVPGLEAVPGWYQSNRELVWSLAAGSSLLAAWAGEGWLGLPRPAAVALYAAAYALGGWEMLRHAGGNALRRVFTFDIDLLMLLAAAGAAVLGEWAEGAFLLFLFSLAHALEHYALGRARGAIRALSDLAPALARVLRQGREVEVPIAEVRLGDTVIVRPAERIPVDGNVLTGQSAVNQAPITGESVPVEKGTGDQVFAGTVNGEGALEVSTTRATGDRTLDRVIRLVEEAQTQKAPTQQFTDRFESVVVPAVLLADLALITLPPLVGLWDLSTSFYRGMALLVAASPCALALGTPAAVLAGIAQAARHGVLIKGGAYLEGLGSLNALALDKTGTLTVGEPEVTALLPANGVTGEELLRIAAAVERRSQHPLAEAVVQRAETEGLTLPEAGDLSSLTGRGVSASVEGKPALLGNLRLWQERGIEIPPDILATAGRLQAGGASVIVVQHGSRWLGVIGGADRPRVDVRAILSRLRELGIRPMVMLTGDNRGVGEAIGREVGVDEVRAELLPEDKVAVVKDLLARYRRVAMVGDGVNDAPALAQATVGIAMGGAGSAAALEAADVALMADDLGRLPFAVGLSRRARGVIHENLYFSLSVVGLLVAGAISGLAGIGPAVLVHEGSTLVVIANALRLLAYHGPDDVHRPEAVTWQEGSVLMERAE
ncbi:MAG: cadmium-translocating P-type ATPase [Chloroflexi bacterium]|nr:cadmium-translocating P-type ATPase [Chloroflexota bacterium]